MSAQMKLSMVSPGIFGVSSWSFLAAGKNVLPLEVQLATFSYTGVIIWHQPKQCIVNFGWNSQVKLGTWIPSCVQIAPGSQCRNRKGNVFKSQEEPKRGIKGAVIKTGPYKCKCRHAKAAVFQLIPLVPFLKVCKFTRRDGAGVCYTCAIIWFLQDLHGCFCLQEVQKWQLWCSGSASSPQGDNKLVRVKHDVEWHSFRNEKYNRK